MVIITNQDEFHIQTPLERLMSSIAESPVLIAPEREGDLANVRAQVPWSYCVDAADGRKGITANPDGNGVVNLPLAQLERLWAMTFGFLAGFDISRKFGAGVEVSVNECPDLVVPMSLLFWATEGIRTLQRLHWPNLLPRPDVPTSYDAATIEKVNRHYLGALGFIILHEVAHLYLKHPSPELQPSADSIRCETEADRWAAAWVFDKCPPNRDARIFRGDCCVLALSMINLLEFTSGPQIGPPTHPPTVERILDFSSLHIPESKGTVAEVDEFPLFLASSILHTQRINLNLDIAPGIEHESMTDYLIDALRVFRERTVAKD